MSKRENLPFLSHCYEHIYGCLKFTIFYDAIKVIVKKIGNLGPHNENNFPLND